MALERRSAGLGRSSLRWSDAEGVSLAVRRAADESACNARPRGSTSASSRQDLLVACQRDAFERRQASRVMWDSVGSETLPMALFKGSVTVPVPREVTFSNIIHYFHKHHTPCCTPCCSAHGCAAMHPLLLRLRWLRLRGCGCGCGCRFPATATAAAAARTPCITHFAFHIAQ